MINILRALSLLLGLLVVTVEVFGAQHEPEDRGQTLEAAVRAGRAGEVHPYLLLQSGDARSTVGAVYTQFVRVARYVWLNNRQIKLADIPNSVKRRELHVVLTIPPRIGDDGPTMAAIDRHPSAQPPGVAAYFVLSERLTPAIAVITPAAFEETVGAIPTERPGLVGMFAPELAQRKVPEFCTYYADTVGNVVHFVCGYVAGPLR
jgi:hypothetical protein